MRSVVIGTAGHIDHGKTTLLRALTGIDADRLPEERARGMTIDVGFAHLDLDDGSSLDFVDVPGHDRLVGNMLVGAGEIDAVLLVVAADDGPRAQTLEHLELLDALGHDLAVVAITKSELVDDDRLAAAESAAREVVARTAMRAAPVFPVSAVSGRGVAALQAALVDLRDEVLRRATGRPHGPVRLAIDRAFTVKGRGEVVTGTLRGGSVRAGAAMRIEPGGDEVRVREVQVHHGRAVEATGGRTALNLAPAATRAGRSLRRGLVLTIGPGVEASDRWLVALAPAAAPGSRGAARPAVPSAWPPRPGLAGRLHLGTAQADATVGPIGTRWPELGPGRVAAIVRVAEAMAGLPGDRAVLRDPGSGRVIGGATLLDPDVPRGPSRRRLTPERLASLHRAVSGASGADASEPAAAVLAATVDLHGFASAARLAAVAAALDGDAVRFRGEGRLASDVEEDLRRMALEALASSGGSIAVAELRATLLRRLRRLAFVDRAAAPEAGQAIDRLVERLVGEGRIARRGDALLDPARQPSVDDELASAMARLEASLDVDVPPGLAEAARVSGCPATGLRALESTGRIVRVEDDLAWSAGRYRDLEGRAIDLARRGPITPAALRDAIGGNRRVALALLEDFGRKGVLRRTDAGHVLGPRVPSSHGPG